MSPNLRAKTLACPPERTVHGPDARPKLEVEAPMNLLAAPLACRSPLETSTRRRDAGAPWFMGREQVRKEHRFGKDKDGTSITGGFPVEPEREQFVG